MKKADIFEVWAPSNGLWSPWVKPILFSWMDEVVSQPVLLSMGWPLEWMKEVSASTALVLDLPGADGVSLGLAMAARGYRPVPLYNAVPGPSFAEVGAADQRSLHPALDTSPIVNALREATPLLAGLGLPPECPPVFLLDANRRGSAGLPQSVDYDNRSISFTTDFPSANFLFAHGIRSVVLVQLQGRQPQADLAHTLRSWQEGGVKLFLKCMDKQGPVVPLTVEKPSMFGRFWYRIVALSGLKRHELGGYGGMLADDSAGG